VQIRSQVFAYEREIDVEGKKKKVPPTACTAIRSRSIRRTGPYSGGLRTKPAAGPFLADLADNEAARRRSSKASGISSGSSARQHDQTWINDVPAVSLVDHATAKESSPCKSTASASAKTRSTSAGEIKLAELE